MKLNSVMATILFVAFLLNGCGHDSPERGDQPRKLRDFQFERTAERVERGRYLVTVAQCFDCHSPVDSTLWLPVPGMEGSGDMIDTVGPEYSPNITPDVETGAGSWTDDMLVRAIREGYGHDGRPLLPTMRSEYYKSFTDEDIASVVVYLRSLPPVRHELPRNNLPEDKRGSREELVEEIPSMRNVNDTLARGAYLVRIATCEHCHSPLDGFGKRKPGLRFGGGTVGVEDSLHPVVSKNLTRDPTGIAYYDPDLFVQTIRTGRVGGVRQIDPWMPWPYLRIMTDEDLKAIFMYLRSQAPVHHFVDNTEPPRPCKLCGTRHGLGDLN